MKDLLDQSKSDGGKNPPPLSLLLPALKKNPSLAAARGSGRRTSAHEWLYEVRRVETEEMSRHTFLPYRQGLLLGCLNTTPELAGLNGASGAADEPEALERALVISAQLVLPCLDALPLTWHHHRLPL